MSRSNCADLEMVVWKGLSSENEMAMICHDVSINSSSNPVLSSVLVILASGLLGSMSLSGRMALTLFWVMFLFILHTIDQ